MTYLNQFRDLIFQIKSEEWSIIATFKIIILLVFQHLLRFENIYRLDNRVEIWFDKLEEMEIIVVAF